MESSRETDPTDNVRDVCPGAMAMIGSRGSTIDTGLLAAYRAALYQVDAAPTPFVLRVGERSLRLAELHAAHRVTCSAFVTAWNPFSLLQADAQNRRAQARLERELADQGYVMYGGTGKDADGGWPGEESVLVIGLPREAAIKVGRAYGQNAVVWSGATAVPELVLVMRR